MSSKIVKKLKPRVIRMHDENAPPEEKGLEILDAIERRTITLDYREGELKVETEEKVERGKFIYTEDGSVSLPVLVFSPKHYLSYEVFKKTKDEITAMKELKEAFKEVIDNLTAPENRKEQLKKIAELATVFTYLSDVELVEKLDYTEDFKQAVDTLFEAPEASMLAGLVLRSYLIDIFTTLQAPFLVNERKVERKTNEELVREAEELVQKAKRLAVRMIFNTNGRAKWFRNTLLVAKDLELAVEEYKELSNTALEIKPVYNVKVLKKMAKEMTERSNKVLDTTFTALEGIIAEDIRELKSKMRKHMKALRKKFPEWLEKYGTEIKPVLIGVSKAILDKHGLDSKIFEIFAQEDGKKFIVRTENNNFYLFEVEGKKIRVRELAKMKNVVKATLTMRFTSYKEGTGFGVRAKKNVLVEEEMPEADIIYAKFVKASMEKAFIPTHFVEKIEVHN